MVKNEDFERKTNQKKKYDFIRFIYFGSEKKLNTVIIKKSLKKKFQCN